MAQMHLKEIRKMGNCPPPLLFRSRTGDARAERGAVVALLHHLKCSVISIK